MVVAGVAGAGVCLYLDTATEAWDGLSFAPNLATSIVGFLVGVPIAYYVITEIVNRRDKARDVDDAERLSAQGWNDFREGAARALTPLVRQGVEHAGMVSEGLGEVLGEYNIMRGVVVNDNPRTQFEITRITAGRNKAGNGHSGVIESIHPGSFSEAWNVVRSRWHFIEDRIKVARLGHGLNWIDFETEKILVNYIDADPNPISHLYDVLRRDQNDSPLVPIGNMWDAMTSIDDFCRTQNTALVEHGGYNKVALLLHDLSSASMEVAMFLQKIDKVTAMSASEVFGQTE